MNCPSGKITYHSELTALRQSVAMGRKFDRQLRYYKCWTCRHYHLTSAVKVKYKK